MAHHDLVKLLGIGVGSILVLAFALPIILKKKSAENAKTSIPKGQRIDNGR